MSICPCSDVHTRVYASICRINPTHAHAHCNPIVFFEFVIHVVCIQFALSRVASNNLQ